MKTELVQLLTAFLGTAGFALVFQMRRAHLFSASLGGCIGWAIYLLLAHAGLTDFYAVLWASVFCAFYGEGMAKFHKAPAILFRTTALVPLVPGRLLYYTMDSMVKSNWIGAQSFAFSTLQWALSISIGASVVAVAEKLIRRAKQGHHLRR